MFRISPVCLAAAVALLLGLAQLPAAAQAPHVLRGRVLDITTGWPVPDARVRMLDPAVETVTDSGGNFALTLSGPLEGRRTIEVSRVGYGSETITPARLDLSSPLEFRLYPAPIRRPVLEVSTTRARERTSAVAFTELDRREVQQKYWAQDVPMLLAETPSVYAYSDAGNGVGYSYVTVRGFSQSRVAVTINGVPENDPESHEVYWVDHPDLLASTAVLQVQRGVGSALYGASSVGGAINLETQLAPAPGARRLDLSAGYGSFNTRRYSVDFESGLLSDRYAVSGRYSRILSDGYRDQSWSDLWSYFLSAVRVDPTVVTRLNVYGGPENLHLAYYGVDHTYLDGQVTGNADRDRRFNPLDWPGETDNFFEPHYEVIQNVRLSDVAALTHTLFFYAGDGYYDDRPDGPQELALNHLPEFEVSDSSVYPSTYYLTDSTGAPVRQPDGRFKVVATDLTQRLWVKNTHYGWVPRVLLRHPHGELTLGGEWREHSGHHFGELTWAQALPPGVQPDQHMYDYTGHVHVQSAFAQESYLPRQDLRLTGSLQLRHTRYGVDQDPFHGYDFHLDYTFLNPRLGVNWNPRGAGGAEPGWNVFASYAHVSVEPILSEIYSADDPTATPLFRVVDVAHGIYQDPLISPEHLNDYEAGVGLRRAEGHVRLTAFWMDFRDEIVPQGQINRLGVPITGNAARSEHKGVELEAALRHRSGLEASGNLSWSVNRFLDYREYVDSTHVNDYSGNSIATFPGLLGNLELAFRRRAGRVALSLHGAGTQYLDNTEDDRKQPELRAEPGYQHKLAPGYALLNASATLDLGALAGARGLTLDVHLLNILDKRYVTSGYVYSEVPYYYPAAGRSVFVGFKAGL